MLVFKLIHFIKWGPWREHDIHNIYCLVCKQAHLCNQTGVYFSATDIMFWMCILKNGIFWRYYVCIHDVYIFFECTFIAFLFPKLASWISFLGWRYFWYNAIQLGPITRPCAGIILCMRLSSERRRYNVTSSLIGMAHSQKEPCRYSTMHTARYRQSPTLGRLLHSLKLVAVGLSKGYETWPHIGCCFRLCNWSKLWLGDTSTPLGSGLYWAHVTGRNSHHLSDAADSPFAQPLRQVKGYAGWLPKSLDLGTHSGHPNTRSCGRDLE